MRETFFMVQNIFDEMASEWKYFICSESQPYPYFSRFIIGGKSVEIPEAPSSGGRVRAVHGASCQVVEADDDEDCSLYTWLMDCDYRGLMPASIVNIAMPVAQMRMIESINNLKK